MAFGPPTGLFAALGSVFVPLVHTLTARVQARATDCRQPEIGDVAAGTRIWQPPAMLAPPALMHWPRRGQALR